MYFRNYGSRKTLLDQCLKSPFSRDPSKSNMVNAAKHCWNVKDSSFTIFIDHCEGNWLAGSLCYWYAKSQDCFVTHWVLMASIFFLIETIERNQFRCKYLENKKLFLIFLLHFWNLVSILNIFKKRWTSLLMYIRKYGCTKTGLDQCLKSRVSTDPSETNMVNAPKRCSNFHGSTFTMFIDHCEGNWLTKSLC